MLKLQFSRDSGGFGYIVHDPLQFWNPLEIFGSCVINGWINLKLFFFLFILLNLIFGQETANPRNQFHILTDDPYKVRAKFSSCFVSRVNVMFDFAHTQLQSNISNWLWYGLNFWYIWTKLFTIYIDFSTTTIDYFYSKEREYLLKLKFEKITNKRKTNPKFRN